MQRSQHDSNWRHLRAAINLALVGCLGALPGCAGCDDDDDEPDVGGFVDIGPPDAFDPGTDGGGCGGGSGSGGSGSSGSGGTYAECGDVSIDCSLADCGHGMCVPGAAGEPDRCACETGYAGAGCNTCDQGFVPSGTSCVPCGPEACTNGACADMGGTTTCLCDTGYEGALCDSCATGFEVSGDRCVPVESEICAPNPCQERHRTVCSDGGDGTPACGCDDGYHDRAGVCVPDCDVSTAACDAAATSFGTLTSANGFSAVGYDVATRTFDTWLEHVYRNYDEDVWTRDLLFDTYLGVRVDGAGVWLRDLEAVHTGYYQESGIIHTVHAVSDILRVETFAFATWQLDRAALVIAGKVTNLGDAPADVSLYTLHNYHVGDTPAVEPTEPMANDERIRRLGGGGYLESGPGAMLLHQPLGAPDHAGTNPNNPFVALTNGEDLQDIDDSGVGEDRVAGFQKNLALAPAASGWFGVVTALDRFGDQAGLEAAVATLGARTADQVVADELAQWEAWRIAPPGGLSAAELHNYRQSEAILRQGQILEGTDKSFGQILASMPPGMWNITWMRDMAYAIAGLVRSGHFQEARWALEFVLEAESGLYESPYVGVPYQVTITRYFGRGREETDFNADGPNIEYDGFGMFLWVLQDYVAASGDTTLLDTYWTSTIKPLVADSLVSLRDSTGLIAPDSSIWEVHWNGQQKHFAYTSLAAARGLCSAAMLANQQGDSAAEDAYRVAGIGIRDAVSDQLLGPDGELASSVEELANNSGYRDVASVEAFNWMVFDPAGDVADASFNAFEQDLRVESGRGFFRNDDGGWYDSQEWVIADMRIALAYQHAGRPNEAAALVDWISAQALANYGMIAELHHPVTSDYEGEVPMVGFGAGTYLIALWNRHQPEPVEPICGTWETP